MNKLKSYDEIKINREFTDKKIKKAKFRFLEFFNKAYNIVIHIRNLDNRADYFRKLIKRIIPMNNRTKWNN
jgi:predicted nucleic acid-binding OB-fold protein